jgi:hypothetical protein
MLLTDMLLVFWSGDLVTEVRRELLMVAAAGNDEVDEVAKETDVTLLGGRLTKGYIGADTHSVSCCCDTAHTDEVVASEDTCEMMVSSLYVGGNCIGCSWNTPKGDPSVLLSTDN